MDRNPETGRPLTDEQVQRILARAAELDRHGEARLTESDVRDIARDVQISTAAVNRAIAEASGSLPIASVNAPIQGPWWKRPLRAAALVVSGACVGPIALAVDPTGLGPEASLLVLGGTAAIAIWRAVRNRQGGTLATYEAELAMLMASATASFGVFHGGDAAQVGAVWWLILAIVGAGIVELLHRPHAREHGAELA